MQIFGSDNQKTFRIWLFRTMCFSVQLRFYDCYSEPVKTRRHIADLMERKREEQKEAERGKLREKEHIMIIFGHWIMYLHLGELQALVRVLISRMCNQRNPFCCRAQLRPSPPSHQSFKCLDPATTNTACHNLTVQFMFIL